jgi:hypothetical protein
MTGNGQQNKNDKRGAAWLVPGEVSQFTDRQKTRLTAQGYTPDEVENGTRLGDAYKHLEKLGQVIYFNTYPGRAEALGLGPKEFSSEEIDDLSPDKSEAQRFLDLLDPTATYFTFQTFDDNAERKSGRLTRIIHGSLDECWDQLAALNAKGAGVFVTVNETDGKGRSAKNVVRIRALFVDLDGSPLEPVMEAKRKSDIIVESSPKRWHAYYLTGTDEVELEKFEGLQRKLAAQFDGDPSVIDLPRVLRMPGFIHRKGKPFLTRIIYTRSQSEAAKALSPIGDDGSSDDDGGNAFQNYGKQQTRQGDELNTLALANLDKWVSSLFPAARKSPNGAYRITSKMLGRDLQEDLSISPLGITDWGVHDMGDPREGRRTATELVIEYGKTREWLEEKLGISPQPSWRECTAKGAPKSSMHNARLGIMAMGIECRHDLFRDVTIIGFKGEASHEIRPLMGELTDAALLRLRFLFSNKYGFDLDDKNVLDAVKIRAFENCFDPVLDMLNLAQGAWDKKARLDTWVVTYLKCKDTPLNRAIGRKVLIAAVRRVRSPGCKFDTIVVLESPEGWNKSTMIRILAGDQFFSDQSILAASDKEVQEQLGGIWMHENADLAGMRKAEVERVKAFASRQVDRARPAYGRVREDRPRRSIEWGTTNNNEYLQSQTGNRRFWPLAVGEIDIEALTSDRLQLLGEAAHYEAKGESLILDKELWGAAQGAQEERRAKDPWEDIISDDTNPGFGQAKNMKDIIHEDEPSGVQRVSSADLLCDVLNIPVAQQTRGHTMRLADVMKNTGWERGPQGKVTINGNRVQGYFRLKNGA